MRRHLTLLVAALAVAAPAFVILNSPQAGATTRFSFTEHLTNVEAVINGQRTLTPMTLPGPGDTFLFRADLLQNGLVVGYSINDCTETFNLNSICSTVFAFTGKGDLMGTALTRGEPSVYDEAITGGTFAYRNAHGDAHAVYHGGADVNWTVNFVTQ